MKLFILFIFVFISCAPDKVTLEGNDFEKRLLQNNAAVTNVKVENDQLKIQGKGLEFVDEVTIKNNSGFSETFSIETKSDFNLVANSLKNISILVGGVFSLVLSNAHGAATFQVGFTLQDGSVQASHLSDMGAQTGQVLKYNGTDWVASDLDALMYAGTWPSSSTEPNASPVGGEYYIVSSSGTFDIGDGRGLRDWEIGDWIVYNSITDQWDQIVNAQGVKSFNGRQGDVSPQTGDYNLSNLGDVNLTGLTANKILKYNGTDWVLDDLASGSVTAVTASGPLSSSGGVTPNISISQADGSTDGYLSSSDFTTFTNKISTSDLDTNNALGTSNTKVPSQNAVKTYVDTAVGAVDIGGSSVGGDLTGTVSNAQIAAGAIVNADINAAAAINYSKLNIADGDLTIAKTSGLQTALNNKLDDSQLDTTNTLGTDDTKVPSQNAVKTYVDAQVGGITDNDTTYTAGIGLSLTGTVFAIDDGGSVTSCTNTTNQKIVWDGVNDRFICATDGGATGGLSSSLGNGSIYIGDGSNTARPRSVTGDITLSNIGVAAISSSVIVNADINAAAAIAYSKLNIADGDLTIAKTSGLQTALNNKLDDSQLDTTNTLGTDDTKVPSQNAVKTYVDAQIGGLTDNDTTYSAGTGLNLTGTIFSIATNGVSSAEVLDNSLTAADLAANSVGASELANNAVDNAAIVNGAVTDAKITSMSVNKVTNGAGLYFTYRPNNTACANNQILKWDNTNSRWVCSNESISGGDITAVSSGTGLTGGGTSGDVTLSVATGGITSSLVADNSLTAADLAANSVGASELANNAVDNAAIVNGAVTDAKIASMSVNKVTNGTGLYFIYRPNNVACANNQVLKWNSTNSRWQCGNDNNSGDITAVNAGSGLTGGGTAGAVTISVATGGITSSHVADNSLTAADLAANSVGASELANSAVDTAAIQNNSVTGDKIFDCPSGQVLLSTGTSWVCGTVPSGAQTFLASGTFTVPAGVSTVTIELWGGGGAGAGEACEPGGTTGGTSSFGSFVSASGSKGTLSTISRTVGTGVSGDINLRGRFTGNYELVCPDNNGWLPCIGASAPRGGSGGIYKGSTGGDFHGSVPGGGGGGRAECAFSQGVKRQCAGGPSGGYAMKTVTGLTSGQNIAVTVGLGQVAGNGCGGNGGNGMVAVRW